jgi:hypothetical protein
MREVAAGDPSFADDAAAALPEEYGDEKGRLPQSRRASAGVISTVSLDAMAAAGETDCVGLALELRAGADSPVQPAITTTNAAIRMPLRSRAGRIGLSRSQ